MIRFKDMYKLSHKKGWKNEQKRNIKKYCTLTRENGLQVSNIHNCYFWNGVGCSQKIRMVKYNNYGVIHICFYSTYTKKVLHIINIAGK